MFGNDDFWKAEKLLNKEEVQQLLDLTSRQPDTDLPRVKTWIIDPSILKDKITLLFGEHEASVTIKTWYDTSRLHADGNDHEFTMYIPLHTTLPDESSGVGIFNAKWRGDYTVFGDYNPDDHMPIKTDTEGLEDVHTLPKLKFDKWKHFGHIPKRFLEYLEVLEYYPFEIGTGLIWDPTYLHCSSQWTQPGHTRTHLLVAVKLI